MVEKHIENGQTFSEVTLLNAPQKINENTLSYNLSQKEDHKCKNFCDHNVILNSLTRDVLDTNYSIENGIKKYWEFKGLCSFN